MKRPLPSFLLLAALLVQLAAGRVSGQTDPKNQGRLEAKPKAPSTAPTTAKSGGFFSFFPFLRKSSEKETASEVKETKAAKPKRTASTNQYPRTTNAAQPTPRPAVKATGSEPIAPPTSVSAEQRHGEEVAASTEKLFHNERLTVSNLFPNPANDHTKVDYLVSGVGSQAKLSFFNALGNPVGDFVLDRAEHRLQIRTSEWPNGMYFYQLSLDGRTLATKKLLVRHQ